MRLKNGRIEGYIVVYTIFASILICCISPITMASVVPVNSNSKIIDGIEYYVQTDKAIYTLGENVEMLYKVTNLNDHSVTFGFPATPEYDFWVQKNGLDFWQKGHGYVFWATSITLDPGESAIYPWSNPPYEWNMKDKNGNLVNIGEFQVFGGLFAIGYVPTSFVSVPISIVPEPSTVLILSLGMLGILRRKNKN